MVLGSRVFLDIHSTNNYNINSIYYYMQRGFKGVIHRVKLWFYTTYQQVIHRLCTGENGSKYKRQ